MGQLLTMIGVNWRMSEFSAAVGIVQYKKLPEFVVWRDNIAKQYTAILNERPIPGLSLDLTP